MKAHVPPELIESFLDELADDAPTLRECALVCHHLSVHAQRLLFKRIVLGRPSRVVIQDVFSISSPADKFHDHIHKFPHLRKLVHELVIADDQERRFYREDKSWLRKDSTVARILPLLEDLRGLEIRGNPKGNRLNFQAWKPDLKSAILLKIPSLAKLSLFFLRDVPLEMLRNVPKLSSLTVDFVLFAPENVGINESGSSRGSLKYFNIRSYSTREWDFLSLPGPNFPLDLTCLTALNVDLSVTDALGGNLDFVTRLIDECRNTIQDFEMSICDQITLPWMYNDSYLHFESLPVLQTLSMAGRLWGLRTPAFNWLLTVLKEIPHIKTLQQIHLSFTINGSNEISPSEPTSARWAEFVEVLLHLRRSYLVTLSICHCQGSDIVNFLKEHLKPLTGQVEVSIRLEMDDAESSISSDSSDFQ